MPASPTPITSAATTDFYADPKVYDILHAPGTTGEVDALERIAAAFSPKALRRGATWLEPACGTARHLRILERRGKKVVGFDLEPAMVEYANSKLERRPKAQAPVFGARLDSFLEERPRLRADFAFNLINTIRHARTDREMLEHLAGVARVLRPGGTYAVGISLSIYGVESPTEDVWSGSRGKTRVTQVVQYLPPGEGAKGKARRDETVISHLSITEGRKARDLDSTYVLRTYSRSQWKALLAKSAMKVVGVVDQDGEPTEPATLGYAVYVLAPR